MIISRVKQGLIYIFCRYKKYNDKIVKDVLNKSEFEIFKKMSEYDKIHSFNLYQKVKKNEILKKQEIYLKLALLHDCGKKNYSLIKRIKKVLFGDMELERHNEKSYEKLRYINLDLAKKARDHHKKNLSLEMKIFQKLDDK
ncbi:phosphohydrolase [Fusobacterium sp. MFO224]|uniref:phosphohydrolase n=1 Tax=Fusobacterium sp. MFO224 TaxID=3378070 RepID=UPI0038523D99